MILEKEIIDAVADRLREELEIVECLQKDFDKISEGTYQEVQSLKNIEEIKDFLSKFVSAQRKLNQEHRTSILHLIDGMDRQNRWINEVHRYLLNENEDFRINLDETRINVPVR